MGSLIGYMSGIGLFISLSLLIFKFLMCGFLPFFGIEFGSAKNLPDYGSTFIGGLILGAVIGFFAWLCSGAPADPDRPACSCTVIDGEAGTVDSEHCPIHGQN